ncbi:MULTISPECIES: hypothetical protein [Xenorhabdus]|uniref:hypothetical protein n=1 Tax=Xenorhabdus TaxID=626 RepID=UPI00064B7D44|nr:MULTISPECIES: hypothetical protein [Xenorhabdus]KLU17162.1 hypothetical protein AAY47_01735 [Xenorhabdus griffiniae]KOP32763.1 hypothetical protein AFK69_13725 [Xenorhabdus sp. GDc328]
MKNSKLVIASLAALFLAGCSAIAQNENIKSVQCRGYIDIKATAKTQSIPLTKYNVTTGKFYSPGHGFVGMMGWHSTEPFSKIECLNEDPRKVK